MKHLYVNLKRFDVPVEYGGVNRLAEVENWAEAIVGGNFGAFTTNRTAWTLRRLSSPTSRFGPSGREKTPADKAHITKVARFVKGWTHGVQIYLKNAKGGGVSL